jgi:homeobox protein YOX1/YHP1
MSAYPDDGYHFSGCFSRGRRPPSSQGNGSHRFFTLPPFASFRSSRPTGRLLSQILTTLVNFSFLLSFHPPLAEHSYSTNQNQSQPERRNEYNDPLNDPSSTWSSYNTSRSTPSMLVAVSDSPLFSVGQQPAFPNDDDPRLQYTYPAPQPQPYQSYRDPSTSYSNHPTTLPPINDSANHPRDERWHQNPYGGTSAANRVQDPVYSPVDSYSGTSFQYPPQHPSQGMLPDTRFSLPVNPSTSPSTGTLRRGPVSVERTTTRSSAHTTSPYSRHPPPSNTSQDHPPPKKKRKRADADQLRVLNEVYARTAFPSTEERQELAGKLNMTPRSVQIWYVLYPLHRRPFASYPL